MIHRLFCLVPATTLLLLLPACSSLPPKIETIAVVASYAGNNTPLPYRVAVMPFTAHSSTSESATTIQQAFYSAFGVLNFSDVSLETIRSTLQRQDLETAAIHPAPPQRQLICQYLGVDALISGEVTVFTQRGVSSGATEAGLKAALTRCNGTLVWQGELTTRDEEGKAVVHLANELVATIPNPPRLTEAPPRIMFMVHNGAGRVLRPGDALRVVVAAESGNAGTWDIGQMVRALPLQEEQRGLYAGEYTIRPGDRGRSVYLMARFTTPSGQAVNQWMDTLAPISFGTQNPKTD